MQVSQAAAAGLRGLIAGPVLIAALWVGALIAYQPVEPPRGELPPSEFSSTRALTVLQDLVGDSIPHPMGSAAAAALRDRIVLRLRQLGYVPQLQTDAFVCDTDAYCGAPANIVVRIPGEQDDSPGVLLAAHYDSVPAGPGASDDGAGVAVVLEIARLLKATPRTRHPIVLLIDEGEEAGLLGAHAFVEHNALSKAIAAVVNIDNRGTSGPSLMFETGSANRWLMQLYSQHVAHPDSNSLYYAVYKLLPNDTDFTVFKNAGYQGFNFAYIGDVANYHTPRDDFAHVSAASVQQQGDDVLAVLRALADAETGAPPPAGEAVYFDVFGRFLMRFPQEFMLPAAALTMLLILATATALIRRQECRLGEIARSLCGLALADVAAVALALGLIFMVRAVNPASMPRFSASPWLIETTCAAAAVVILCALSLALGRRVRFWSLWSANAIWTAAFALLLAVKLKGASYLALLPAAAALMAMLLRLGTGPKPRLPELATLGYLLVAFGLFLPILIFLYAGLGRPGLPLLILLPVFGATPMAGLLSMAGRDLQRAASAAAVLLMLIGAAAAAIMPAYAVHSPQALNLHFVEDRTAGSAPKAHWLISQAAHALAPQFRLLLSFNPVSLAAANPLLILQRYEFWAEAQPLDLAAPTLVVDSAAALPPAGAGPRRVHYELRVVPNDTVSEMQIAIAPQAQVRFVRVKGAGLSLDPWKGDWVVMSVVNPPAEGLTLSFEAADAPYDIDLANVTYGLPPAAAELLEARPADTTTTDSGNDTRTLTTVHMAKLP